MTTTYTHIQCIGYQVPTVAKIGDENDEEIPDGEIPWNVGTWTIPSGNKVELNDGTSAWNPVEIISLTDTPDQDAYVLVGNNTEDEDEEDYLSVLEADSDAYNRVVRFLNTLAVAQKNNRIDIRDTTLKVFMAPEFYFRPEHPHSPESSYHAYSYITYKAIKEVLRKTISGGYNNRFNFRNWLIIPGTIIWKIDVENPTDPTEILDTYFNSCIYIHIDNYGNPTSHKLEKAKVSEIDGVPMGQNGGSAAPLIAPRYYGEEKLARHRFLVGTLRVGLEICLEHRMFDGTGLLKRFPEPGNAHFIARSKLHIANIANQIGDDTNVAKAISLAIDLVYRAFNNNTEDNRHHFINVVNIFTTTFVNIAGMWMANPIGLNTEALTKINMLLANQAPITAQTIGGIPLRLQHIKAVSLAAPSTVVFAAGAVPTINQAVNTLCNNVPRITGPRDILHLQLLTAAAVEPNVDSSALQYNGVFFRNDGLGAESDETTGEYVKGKYLNPNGELQDIGVRNHIAIEDPSKTNNWYNTYCYLYPPPTTPEQPDVLVDTLSFDQQKIIIYESHKVS